MERFSSPGIPLGSGGRWPIGWEAVAAAGVLLGLGIVAHALSERESIKDSTKHLLRDSGIALLTGSVLTVAVATIEERRQERTIEIQREIEEERLGRELRQGFQVALSMNPDLDGVVLRGQDLRGVVLSGRSMIRSNLIGANLIDAILVRADLTDANFHLADLSGADMGRATLTRADFREADLTGANLSEADLSEAYLTNATLTGVRCDAGTIWPDGFDPDTIECQAPDGP